MENELIKIVETSGLEQTTSNTLKERFLPFLMKAEEWKTKAYSLVVTNESQVAEMKMARTARLALKEIRIAADKTRKELKEDSIRYGKAVQGVYNIIEQSISPIEEHLQLQEDFIKIQEEKRIAELTLNRKNELLPYSEFVPVNLDLGTMSEEDYAKTLNGAKLQFQANIELLAKAEEERKAREAAKEKKEAFEKEQMRLELERMKAEAEKERERLKAQALKLKLEKQKAEEKLKAELEKLKAEKEANEKLQAELKEKQEKEAAELKAKLLAEKKAMAAPDKIKLDHLRKFIDTFQYPELKTDEAKKIVSDVKILMNKVSAFIKEKSSSL